MRGSRSSALLARARSALAASCSIDPRASGASAAPAATLARAILGQPSTSSADSRSMCSLTRSLASLSGRSRGFASAPTKATASAYGVTDETAFEVPREALERDGGGGEAKPTRRKNHLKRMAAREAFRRENARVHKENEQRNALERQAKRLAKWRAAVALRAELAAK